MTPDELHELIALANELRELIAAGERELSQQGRGLCRHCHGELTGRQRWWDSKACEKRGARRAKAGLPEDSYPDGAHRGRVPLGQPTYAEEISDLLRVIPRLEPGETSPRRTAPSGE